jgi:hypothetical protein
MLTRSKCLDFIGTRNWYKRIETHGKVGLRLANTKSATVVSPDQYKARFRDAMEQYFLSVPGKLHIVLFVIELCVLICMLDKWIKTSSANTTGPSIKLPPVL